MTPSHISRRAGAAVGLVSVLFLTACGGNSSSTTVATSPTVTAAPYTAPTFTPGQSLSKSEVVTLLPNLYSRLTTAHVNVTGQGNGSGTVTLTGDANYTTTPVELSGQMLMSLMPTTSTIKTVFSGGKLYINIADMTGSQYVETSFSQISAVPGVDLLNAIDPRAAFSTFSTAISGGIYVGNETVNGVQADHYTVTLDSAALLKADPSLFMGAPPDVLTQFAKVKDRPYEDIWVDAQGNIVQVVTTLDEVTSTLTLSSFGEPVSITVPSADQITSLSGLGLGF
jgi:hypothetical protein